MVTNEASDKKFETGYVIFSEPGYLYSTTVWKDRIDAQAMMEEAAREWDDCLRGEQEVIFVKYLVKNGEIVMFFVDEDRSWQPSNDGLFVGSKN